MPKAKQMSTDVWQRVHSCKHNQLCKSTKKGVWVDCMLGKGYICDPSTGYCQFEAYDSTISTMPTEESHSYKCLMQLTEICKDLTDKVGRIQSELADLRKEVHTSEVQDKEDKEDKEDKQVIQYYHVGIYDAAPAIVFRDNSGRLVYSYVLNKEKALESNQTNRVKVWDKFIIKDELSSTLYGRYAKLKDDIAALKVDKEVLNDERQSILQQMRNEAHCII